jgi:hypothetical protein
MATAERILKLRRALAERLIQFRIERFRQRQEFLIAELVEVGAREVRQVARSQAVRVTDGGPGLREYFVASGVFRPRLRVLNLIIFNAFVAVLGYFVVAFAMP